MSVVSDVATYLQTNSIGTLGTNLFKQFYPDIDGALVAVLDTGGQQPEEDIPLYLPTFQVFVRSTSYALGKAKLEAIRDLLHRQANVQLVSGGTYFYYILAQSNGGSIGRNENGKDEFSINFICKIR